MKTQIIALESHDDLISVRDRMSWAKLPSIFIVRTKYEKVKLRPVDLLILKQHARYLGADLGLVTRLASVRRDAQGFRIPIFESPAEAQRAGWPARPQSRHRSRAATHPGFRRSIRGGQVNEPEWQSKPIARIGFFAMGVLASLAVAALFFPHATIRLSPLSQQQTMTLHVVASPSIESIHLSGSLPAPSINVAGAGLQTIPISTQA